jgi:hypothetical protein
MHAVLGHTMPLFAKKLEGIDATKYKDIIDEIKGISRTKDPKTGQEVGSYVKTYNKIYRNPELREMFSKEFGLNEFARPQVGQAFSQINNEFERKQAAELWNFHWAGVVMRDGDHYMTMENLSIEDESLSNDKWYFRMYKDEGQQSFHHLNSLDSHVGDHPMTVLFRPDNDYVPGTAQK